MIWPCIHLDFHGDISFPGAPLVDPALLASQAAMCFSHSIPWNRCQPAIPALDFRWKCQEQELLESMRELLALLMFQWQLERHLATLRLRDDLRLVLTVLERRVKFLGRSSRQPPVSYGRPGTISGFCADSPLATCSLPFSTGLKSGPRLKAKWSSYWIVHAEAWTCNGWDKNRMERTALKLKQRLLGGPDHCRIVDLIQYQCTRHRFRANNDSLTRTSQRLHHKWRAGIIPRMVCWIRLGNSDIEPDGAAQTPSRLVGWHSVWIVSIASRLHAAHRTGFQCTLVDGYVS